MKKPIPEEFLSLPAGETENYSEIYPFRYVKFFIKMPTFFLDYDGRPSRG